MRSTTPLIASLAVVIAACGPMTVQYVPVNPTTPVVDTGNPKPDPEPDPDDRDRDELDHEAWERDKPPVVRDTTAGDPWDPDEPVPPSDDDEDEDSDTWGDDRPDKPVAPDDDTPAPNDPGTPPSRPGDDGADDRPTQPPHIQPRPPQPDTTAAPRERPNGGRPPHIQPRPPQRDTTATDDRGQPENPGRPDEPGTPDEPEQPDEDLGQPRELRIPPGHMPRDNACRVWIEGTPPGRQAPPVACARLVGIVPEGAFILYGDRVWDMQYDWIAHERRTPGSVPAVILDLTRSL